MRRSTAVCLGCRRATAPTPTSVSHPRRPGPRAACPQAASMATASMATASMATVMRPAAAAAAAAAPISRHPRTQPPSYKPPEMRKSQLLRQYASLLRSTPMMVMFQHNNVKSVEWMGIRREMLRALRKVDELEAAARGEGEGEGDDAGHSSPSRVGMADKVKIQTVQTGIFDVALRVVEYYRPAEQQRSSLPPAPAPTTTSTQSTTPSPPTLPPSPETTPTSAPDPDLIFTHTLSRAAHQAASQRKGTHPLSPLLSGPLALLTFPGVSPEHLRAALSILSPQSPMFAAPTRRANPGYHEPLVQQGLQKLLLLGARVEGRALDAAALRAVGALHGGIDALRAQLVVALQGLGLGVTSSLDSAGLSLYLTLQGRRVMLEDDGKEKEEGKE